MAGRRAGGAGPVLRLRALALAAALSGCTAAPPAYEEAPRASVVAGWPAVTSGAELGEVTGVDIDANGRVYVLHRADREWREPFPADPIAQPTVFVYDGPSGRLLKRWGGGHFIMPHGLSIDPQGKVWITDVGRQQVLRFSADGELEQTLGERGVGGSDARHFGRPTDVAFNGNEVFVTDGYHNHRVAVFDRSGRFLRQWGEEGAGQNGFAVPHAITLSKGAAYVADRENARIRVTDLEGRPIAIWRRDRAAGYPYSVKPMGYSRFVSVEGRDAHDRSGAILRIWRPDGSLERSYDAALPGEGASLGHDIAVGADGMAYVADTRGKRVLKIDLSDIGAN